MLIGGEFCSFRVALSSCHVVVFMEVLWGLLRWSWGCYGVITGDKGAVICLQYGAVMGDNGVEIGYNRIITG